VKRYYRALILALTVLGFVALYFQHHERFLIVTAGLLAVSVLLEVALVRRNS
jgi:hypothetical protein